MRTFFSARLRFLCLDSSAVQFSTMTIVASSIAPIAIHRPARENKLIVWLNPAIGKTVNRTLSKRMTIGPAAVRSLLRKRIVTRLTITSSDTSVAKNSLRVAQIHDDRSYVETISTPLGREALISFSFRSRDRLIARTF